MEIPILFENENFLVINKPAGLSVHPDGRRDSNTLVNWILEKYPEIRDVGEPMEVEYQGEVIKILRPGIVHRLDRDTTGCMIIAKNHFTYGFLKKAFKKHTVKKTYRAFVYGFIKQDMGTIDAPIGRAPGDIRKWNAGRGVKGESREAKTYFRVINRFETNEIIETENSEIENTKFKKGTNPQLGKISYVECYPQTGRTHQIRVHMRFINHPIVSDFLYAENKPKMLGFERTALHAFKIEIPQKDAKSIVVEAPFPEDFKMVIEKYGL
jgi:23S rRNA pseudouridine1911/1915/1917 synthase